MSSAFPPDKTLVLITGANREDGIGYNTAAILASRHEDFHILLGARTAAAAAEAASKLQAQGLSVEPIAIDVSSDDSIGAAVSEVREKYGRLDVLVNNAGIARDFDTTTALDRRALHETFDVNVFGAALVTEAFAPLLRRSSAAAAAAAARVVFVSSHVGSLGMRSDSAHPWYPRLSHPRYPMYRASKAALNMFVLHFAQREAGWKVNAACPGLTATRFSQGRGRPVQEGCEVVVQLAEGKIEGTGGYWDDEGKLPW